MRWMRNAKELGERVVTRASEGNIIWGNSAQTFTFGSTFDSLMPGRLNCINKPNLIRKYKARMPIY